MNLMPPKPTPTQSRLSWIDYDKGISIILVCYLHLAYLLQYYFHVDPDAYWILKYSNIFLYGFRMPLFFMISGVLLQGNLARKGFSGYVKNRFNTIFYPLLVWGFIRVTLQLALGNLSPKHGSPLLYLYILADPRKIAPLWYLHALFCISVLYAIVKVKLRQSAWSNLVLGLMLYLVSDYVTTRGIKVGFLDDILKYYIFFAAGDLMSGAILSESARKLFYSWKLILILSVPFALVQTIAMKTNIAHRSIFYVENGVPMLYLLQGLVGCSFSIAISFLLQKWNTLPGLKKIGSRSLYIYCMHYMVIIVCGTILVKMMHFHNTLLLVGICWAAAVGIPIWFYNATNRLNLWWLFSLNKPKAKREQAFSEVQQKSPPVISESLS